MELRRSFPWIVWRIWTNRNLTVFEGKKFSAVESIEKVRGDILEWNEAQVMESVGEVIEIGSQQLNSKTNSNGVPNTWQPPPVNWLKCNIGISW